MPPHHARQHALTRDELRAGWQLRKVLNRNGFTLEKQNPDGTCDISSPLEGRSAVAVLYSLLVHGVAHEGDKIKMDWLKADCACVHSHAVALPRPHITTHLWWGRVLSTRVDLTI